LVGAYFFYMLDSSIDHAAHVKLVVASVTQPRAEYRCFERRWKRPNLVLD
jgi:hypothetical protein